MKTRWIYGPRQPANSKKSKLGFPSITGEAKPPLPGGPTVETLKTFSCDDCGTKAKLIKVTIPNPNAN